jgi:hypothetical protein
MPLRDRLYQGLEKTRRSLGMATMPNYDEFDLPRESMDRLRLESKSELARLFYNHRGRLVDKWVHYLDIYERHLGPLRNSQVRMLEIGVLEGGSLELWREYLGMDAVIFGIDIDPGCANRFDPPNQVRIGSQDDRRFLERVVSEMGGINVVLDDGSHINRHQIASFQILFPMLAEGGLYLIEDLHTSYWPGVFEGGLRRRGTGIELVKGLIDEMHDWYRRRSPRVPNIGAIHVYDSMVVLEKRAAVRPYRVRVAGIPSH